jgi:hypothetical protein
MYRIRLPANKRRTDSIHSGISILMPKAEGRMVDDRDTGRQGRLISPQQEIIADSEHVGGQCSFSYNHKGFFLATVWASLLRTTSMVISARFSARICSGIPLVSKISVIVPGTSKLRIRL